MLHKGTPLPSSRLTDSSVASPNCISPPLSSCSSRLWRPAAQRNIKNQWSKLLMSKDRWVSATLEGRLHATELVNTYLKRRYLPEMNLGVLTEIPGIREKAYDKLVHKQDLCRHKLISSYKNMAVREIYEVVPARRWRETEQKMNKIVFIGRDLDETVLRNSFKSCIL